MNTSTKVSNKPIAQNLSLENLENEVWKDIPEYNGLFKISNKGRVLSKQRKVRYVHAVSKDVFYRLKNSTIRKLTINKKNGYSYVSINNNGKTKTHSIHRLVAKAFIKNNNNNLVVNHKNGIKTDNCSSNLEWVTLKENSKHASLKGFIKKGSKHYKSFLSEIDIVEILKSDDKISEIAKKYNTNYRCIWQIKKGITRNNQIQELTVKKEIVTKGNEFISINITKL